MQILLATEVIAQRVFNTAYIYLDIAFLVGLCTLLAIKRKWLTLLFGLAGGVLYMIVDYGIFHLALHTRTIENGNLFWVLLWMSMSYGITNFVWIWLWFSREKQAWTWTLMILVWWICAPMLSEAVGANAPVIKIQRTTGSYHGYMALIMIVGYFAAIVWNLFQADRSKRFPLLFLFAVGVSVQLGWEFSLLVGNIRSAAITDMWDKLRTLVVNSLVETNLGAVPIYCIYVAVSARWNENLSKRTKVNFTQRLSELNCTPLKEI